ncbi:anti-anti-sigma factor [Jatrophihabitans endophyticus]|uniref:Anti-anti-sigma factor n=2 Tax=Jatrophihabitans endophyticus TaxID=1206085 RepID=A0A1M5C2A1_9ACTN|nr:anti-anti-sigma factor [Jatrophihabitans endophyticus]
MPPYPSLDPPRRFVLDPEIAEGDVDGDGVRVARVGGELDYVVTPRLRGDLLDRVDGAATLVLDLSEVTLLSAAAMEMLLAVDVLGTARGCEVRIVAGTRAVRRPLTLTGLDERLRLFDSLDAARRG